MDDDVSMHEYLPVEIKALTEAIIWLQDRSCW